MDRVEGDEADRYDGREDEAEGSEPKPGEMTSPERRPIEENDPIVQPIGAFMLIREDASTSRRFRVIAAFPRDRGVPHPVRI